MLRNCSLDFFVKKQQGNNKMSRQLWLLRHGKSDRNLAVDDYDRPLKKRGKKAAESMGVWLKKENLIPDNCRKELNKDTEAGNGAFLCS